MAAHGVNTEAKYLMLRHAFEVWKCMRVELKTDALNQKSRNAILRIGAKEEGTLRRHLLTWTGRVRDTVYFSILDNEWPEVKARLEVIVRGSTLRSCWGRSPAMNWIPVIALPTGVLSLVRNRSVGAAAGQARCTASAGATPFCCRIPRTRPATCIGRCRMRC